MCTRVIYTPETDKSYVGRNMDWGEPPEPALWLLPPGVKRYAAVIDKEAKPIEDEFHWISDYGSVITSNYNIATSDGINSRGLTANLLWLASSEYPSAPIAGKQPMSLSIWTQYILDTCATVSDAIKAMQGIYIVSAPVPGRPGLATCHLSVGDQEGNSVVFEYVNGALHTYTNVEVDFEVDHYYQYSRNQMRVMTNDPVFNKQIESLVYWDEVNSVYQSNNRVPALLPGSNLALSRFVRASYFTRELPDDVERTEALAGLTAVIDNAAQPFVQAVQGTADLSKTQYSNFADATNKQYFYRSAYSPFLIWTDLPDDGKNEKVHKLKLNEKGVFTNDEEYGSGNVSKYFEEHEMFHFLPAEIPG